MMMMMMMMMMSMMMPTRIMITAKVNYITCKEKYNINTYKDPYAINFNYNCQYVQIESVHVNCAPLFCSYKSDKL